MTREEKIKALTMRVDGYTYQAIADEIGISKQAIQNVCTRIVNNRRSYHSKEASNKCVYKNMSICIDRLNMNAEKLYDAIYSDSKNKPVSAKTTYMMRRLKGISTFTPFEWTKMAKIFGCPIEKLMELKEEQCSNT